MLTIPLIGKVWISNVTQGFFIIPSVNKIHLYWRCSDEKRRSIFAPTNSKFSTNTTLFKKVVICYASIWVNHWFRWNIYHARQLQYRAFQRGPGFEQLCLARNDLRRAGSDFFIFMLGSPKLTFTTLPLSFFT